VRPSEHGACGWTEAPDAAGFMALFWSHGPGVHAYLARRAGRQVADDLFGEVWLRAFRARATYDHRSTDPQPWLYGVARNTLRAHWRLQRRVDPISTVDVPDPWDEIDGRLDASRHADELRRALALLTPDEREVLLLVAWERLTPAEVALTLGIPQGTARSRLHRARHTLQGVVEPPVVACAAAATPSSHKESST
jgi:RNA polymerase sigma factor (sigma-70 family)